MFEDFTQKGSPFTQNWQQNFKRNDILTQLISINILVFLVITVSGIFFFLTGFRENPLLKILSVPSSFEAFFTRPWGIFTYVFTHSGFFHLLFNMLCLGWMGRMFIKYFDEQKLLWMYIGGGIGGALLYMLAYNNLAVFAVANIASYAIGASASVMAIFFAVAFYDPNKYIFLLFIGHIKIIHLALGLVVLDLLMLQGSNSGGHISHFGGALVGLAFGLYMKRYSFPKSERKTQGNYYKHTEDYSYNTSKKQEEDEINAILDKISKSGYESLTSQERKKLFKSSYKK